MFHLHCPHWRFVLRTWVHVHLLTALLAFIHFIGLISLEAIPAYLISRLPAVLAFSIPVLLQAGLWLYLLDALLPNRGAVLLLWALGNALLICLGCCLAGSSGDWSGRMLSPAALVPLCALLLAVLLQMNDFLRGELNTSTK